MNQINKLPKVELHLHLDCSLSYEVVSKIDPSVTEAIYQADYISREKCVNLDEFLRRAVKGFALMQTKEQLQLVVHDLFKQMTVDNMLYAEIRFAPLQHLEQGLTVYEVVAAVEEATAAAIIQTGIEARLILCTLRHFTEEQSMETVKLVEVFKGTCVAGFDIAGSEAGFPVTNHVKAFRYARGKNIPCTAHAGEAKGAASVWETLEQFGVSRIGHGVRSAEDEKLIAYLCAKNIHLEVCPTCNVLIDIYDSYSDHTIEKLYRAGVSLSVNTDNRTITNINLNKEYEKLQAVFNWTNHDFYICNVNALQAAFISADLKTKLLAKLAVAYNEAQ
ncbi:adenosine deaminase [soil metagenome]